MTSGLTAQDEPLTASQPSAFGQLRSIWWAQRRMAWHRLVSVTRQSKLKVGFVTLSATLLWFGFFLATSLVLELTELFGGIPTQGVDLLQQLMGRLLATMAMALSLLLVISNLLISFASLYRAKDLGFYLQRPVGIRTFFLARFTECVWMSSWATAYLASPVVLAYGWSTGQPPGFYLAALLFYAVFVTLPAAVGALLVITCVPLTRHLRWLIWPALGALAFAVFGLFRRGLAVPDLTASASLQAAVDRVGFSQSPFLPSQWLAAGIQQAASGDLGRASLYLLALLASSAVVLGLALAAAERWYHHGRATLEEAAATSDKGRAGSALDRATAPLRWLRQPWQALVVKDVKQFWRDPAQWSQFVIFFGLLALYLASSSQTIADPKWRSWRALLNSTAGLLILATLTTRFVFPLISLEGRRFWIVGMSPVTVGQLVRQKLWTSAGLTGVFTLGLACLSAYRLGLEPATLALTLGSSAAGTLALSGLAVGLGSLYVNLDEDNPARIVSGLGGTLTFLLSMAYIAAMSAGLAVLLQWPRLEVGSELGLGWIPWLVGLAMVALSGFTCCLPLVLGTRHLDRLEL